MTRGSVWSTLTRCEKDRGCNLGNNVKNCCSPPKERLLFTLVKDLFIGLNRINRHAKKSCIAVCSMYIWGQVWFLCSGGTWHSLGSAVFVNICTFHHHRRQSFKFTRLSTRFNTCINHLPQGTSLGYFWWPAGFITLRHPCNTLRFSDCSWEAINAGPSPLGLVYLLYCGRPKWLLYKIVSYLNSSLKKH